MNAEGALIVATANFADGEVSRHLLDRLGLAAAMQVLKKPDERRNVLAAMLRAPDPAASQSLVRRVEKACERLAQLPRLSGTRSASASPSWSKRPAAPATAATSFSPGPRALAAWESAPTVTSNHVERIAPLVLDHRRAGAWRERIARKPCQCAANSASLATHSRAAAASSRAARERSAGRRLAKYSPLVSPAAGSEAR